MTTERRVLLVITSTYPRWNGDTEPSFVHELSRRLAENFHVVVIAPHAPGALRRENLDGVEVVRFRYAPVTLQRLAFAGGILTNLRKRPWTWLLIPGFFCALAWNLARQLRKHDFAVIHAHWLIPQAWIALMVRKLFGKQRNIPILATSHGTDLFSLNGLIGKRLKYHVLDQADHITVVSNAMREHVETLGILSAKLSVAPMGVDAQKEFSPLPTNTREVATVLFVGRLVESKGVNVLLHAFSEILDKRPDAKLRVIGDGPQRGYLLRLANELGITASVEFIGALPHSALPNEFRRATVFVMPSTGQEGFGLVLVEAMSCGCPVIASDSGAARDIVTGGTGVLVPPNDGVALGKAIMELIQNENKRSMLGVRARDRVLSHFDWSIASDNYRNVIDELANEHY